MIVNCTIADNTALGPGGYLYLKDTSDWWVCNFILSNNEDSGGSFGSGCTGGEMWYGFEGPDPGFVDSNAGDYHLSEDAHSCIDQGGSSLVPAGITKDLDGNSRFIYEVDLGAYEYQQR